MAKQRPGRGDARGLLRTVRTCFDEVDPRKLRAAFTRVIGALQRGKALEGFTWLDGHSLLSVDGTGYFSSSSVQRHAFRLGGELPRGLGEAPQRQEAHFSWVTELPIDATHSSHAPAMHVSGNCWRSGPVLDFPAPTEVENAPESLVKRATHGVARGGRRPRRAVRRTMLPAPDAGVPLSVLPAQEKSRRVSVLSMNSVNFAAATLMASAIPQR